MKRYVFKWSAVFVLLSLAIFCVYLYSNLSPELVEPTTPSTPTVSTPDKEVFLTTYPKAPLYEPFLGCDYLLPITGSGDDEVLELLTHDEFYYAFGNTDSPDYDFGVKNKSCFVMQITNNGVAKKVATMTGSYLHSKLTPFGIVVALLIDDGVQIILLDYDLNLEDSFIHPRSKSAKIVLTASKITVLTTSPSAVINYTKTDGFSYSTIDVQLTDIVSLEYIQNTLYAVANTDSQPVILTISNELYSTTVSNMKKVDSAIPFFDKRLGFVLSGKDMDIATISAVFCDGEVSWAKRFFNSSHTFLVPSSEGYLVFIREGESSTCIRLCSHGDIVENCVLPFTNLFPISYFLVDATTFLLLKDTQYDKSTVATFSVADSACMLYQFDASPCGFVPSLDGVILSLSVSQPFGNFSSGKGGLDCFLLKLK